MKTISPLLLSDYQRAILSEMGISSWQLANTQQMQKKVENPSIEAITALSEVISKEDALARLKQLKIQTQKTETIESVLVTLSQSDTKLQIFSDILIALGLETKQYKRISVDQLSHYSGYPLSWIQGEKVSVNHKQLTTPTLAKLQHSDTKKQLWQQLHSALSIPKKLTL